MHAFLHQSNNNDASTWYKLRFQGRDINSLFVGGARTAKVMDKNNIWYWFFRSTSLPTPLFPGWLSCWLQIIRSGKVMKKVPPSIQEHQRQLFGNLSVTILFWWVTRCFYINKTHKLLRAKKTAHLLADTEYWSLSIWENALSAYPLLLSTRRVTLRSTVAHSELCYVTNWPWRDMRVKSPILDLCDIWNVWTGGRVNNDFFHLFNVNAREWLFIKHL